MRAEISFRDISRRALTAVTISTAFLLGCTAQTDDGDSLPEIEWSENRDDSQEFQTLPADATDAESLRLNSGQRCSEHEECEEGLSCSSNNQPPVCLGPDEPGGQRGMPCYFFAGEHAGCAGNLSCVDASLGDFEEELDYEHVGECQGAKSAGAPCVANDDCESLYVCNTRYPAPDGYQGQCRVPEDVDGPCYDQALAAAWKLRDEDFLDNAENDCLEGLYCELVDPEPPYYVPSFSGKCVECPTGGCPNFELCCADVADTDLYCIVCKSMQTDPCGAELDAHLECLSHNCKNKVEAELQACIQAFCAEVHSTVQSCRETEEEVRGERCLCQ